MLASVRVRGWVPVCTAYCSAGRPNASKPNACSTLRPIIRKYRGKTSVAMYPHGRPPGRSRPLGSRSRPTGYKGGSDGPAAHTFVSVALRTDQGFIPGVFQVYSKPGCRWCGVVTVRLMLCRCATWEGPTLVMHIARGWRVTVAG